MRKMFFVFLSLFLVSQAYGQKYGNVNGNYALNVFAQSNFVTNPNAVMNTVGLSTTQSSTLSRVTTTPLFANTEFNIADAGAWDAVWATRAFDAGMKNRNCEVAMTVRGVAAGTTTLQVLQNAVAVFSQTVVLDATNPKRIGGTFPCGDLTYTSTISLAGSGAITGAVEAGGVYIGLPVSVSSGQITTEPITFTPTMTHDSGGITNATAAMTYSRRGNMLVGSVGVTFSGASAAFSALYFTLPNGLVVDTAKLGGASSYDVGYGQARDAGVGNYRLNVRTFSSASFNTKLEVQVHLLSAFTGTVPIQNGVLTNAFPITFNTSDTVQVQFEVPIVGWAATDIVTPESSLTRYFYNTGTTATAGGTNAAGSTVEGASGTALLSFDSTSDNVTIFNVTIPAYDPNRQQVILELFDGNNWTNAALRGFGAVRQGTAFYGVNIGWTTVTNAQLYFGNRGARTTNTTYGSNGDPWSNYTTWKWRLSLAPRDTQAFYIQGPVRGGNSGNAIGAGYVGEEVIAYATATTTTTANTEIDVTGMSIVLTQGLWDVEYSVTSRTARASSALTVYGRTRITDSANAVEGNTEETQTVENNAISIASAFGTMHKKKRISVGAGGKTFKLRMACSESTAAGIMSIYQGDVTGGLTGNEATSYIRAVRID
jgi:hypothetical protein